MLTGFALQSDAIRSPTAHRIALGHAVASPVLRFSGARVRFRGLSLNAASAMLNENEELTGRGCAPNPL